MKITLVFALFLAYFSVVTAACKDCSSLANNDNVPQGDGPLAELYTEKGFQNYPFGIPEGYVSARFAPIIKSVKVPPEYELIMYDQDENSGSYVVISGRDVPSLEEYYFSARMRSIRYDRKTEKTLQHPQIFESKSYAGEHHFLPFGITKFPEYPVFASLKVPIGVKVKLTTVYGPRFSKREIVITSDSDQLPFSEPVELIEVSFQAPEL